MSFQVFYRKYRPKSFSELHGQEFVKDILTNSILNKSFSHGYLFSGPRGTGKTTTARLFARAVNDPEFHKNKDLTKYIKDSIDIIEMDAASNRGIEEIRTLRDNIMYLPAELSYKVYIIDEAHMLTKEAFNALLKTLEEPPEHIIFILATTEAHKIPVTILSRVTRLDFTLGSEEQVLKKLRVITDSEEIEIDDEALEKIFRISGGSFRDSESILGKLSSISKTIDIKLIDDVYGTLPDDKIEEIINSILNKDINIFSNQLNEIEDSNIEFLLESIITNLIERKENLDLLEIMLEILIKHKRVRNKKIYIVGKLQSFLSVESVRNETSSSKKNNVAKTIVEKKEPEKEKKSNNDVSPKVQSTKVNTETKPQSESADSSEILSKLIQAISKEDRRLSGVLNTCKISIDDTTVSIFNKYKFNIVYLSKEENKKLILANLANFDSDMAKLKVKVEQVEEDDTSNHEEISVVAISNPISNKSTGDNSSKEDDQDNSELVEKILL